MNHSGLLGLARGMRAYFEAAGLGVTLHVGWTARYRQTNQGSGGASRVVLIPGELGDTAPAAPKALKAGIIDRDFEQNFVELNPQLRVNALWHYPVTCSVWAVDPTRPQDEEAQIYSTETLLELTIQVLKNAVDPLTGAIAGAANIEEYGQPSWTLPPGESSFGRELTFLFVLRVPLFEQPISQAFPAAAVARNPAA